MAECMLKTAAFMALVDLHLSDAGVRVRVAYAIELTLYLRLLTVSTNQLQCRYVLARLAGESFASQAYFAVFLLDSSGEAEADESENWDRRSDEERVPRVDPHKCSDQCQRANDFRKNVEEDWDDCPFDVLRVEGVLAEESPGLGAV